MKKMEKYIYQNWILLTTGMILTRKAVEIANAERGYVAYGGEWLMLPLILLAVDVAKNILDLVRYLCRMEDKNGSD